MINRISAVAAAAGMFCLVLSSCKPATQTVNIKGDYSMEIPKHMTSTTELNDDASLQYQDPAKELYVIVIDESKEEFINTFKDLGEYDSTKTAERNYREVQLKSMTDNLDLKTQPEIKKQNINGLDAEVADFRAMAEGIDQEIYYKFAFVEGKTNMYMVMTWTLSASKDKYGPEMDAMLNSFKLQK